MILASAASGQSRVRGCGDGFGSQVSMKLVDRLRNNELTKENSCAVKLRTSSLLY
jgi:hypothetical protein